ncbi:elongation of very long chain fatty acids protein AAEL008004-like [Solenopsis invicta]|uniref:elongation of very long chain fatty acids protein AAEL008004-like n=1 Tax=Solenopsis invicta TaxID=13686 RepID=UPI00193DE878|nr:elongation of very long chain fatty acids protein AAEL008004-like [Solenopsis invicta]
MDFLQNMVYYWTKELDPRVADLLFVDSAYQIPLIIFAYLYFVVVYGPKFMKNKPPYKLKTFIQLYNIIQIFLNTWLIYESTDAGLFTNKIICLGPDYSYNYNAMRITRCVWIYLLLKIFDLVETVLFVLRKKDNQVSGLHLYHHVSSVLIVWLCVRYLNTTFIGIIGVINCLIHVIMYTYYFLAACGPIVQKTIAPIKRWITTAQMIQFIVVLLYVSHPLILCNKITRIWFTIMLIIHLLINFFNFHNFYVRSYKKNQ